MNTATRKPAQAAEPCLGAVDDDQARSRRECPHAGEVFQPLEHTVCRCNSEGFTPGAGSGEVEARGNRLDWQGASGKRSNRGLGIPSRGGQVVR